MVYVSDEGDVIVNVHPGSHLFQRVASFLQLRTANYITPTMKAVLISFREWLHSYYLTAIFLENFWIFWFSSLSESGFIPTIEIFRNNSCSWQLGSHLFQRVASFLLFQQLVDELETKYHVLISFREWLHSYF